MTKLVCEVIKKIKEDTGFDRALSFTLFKKWQDIVPASADEWPISANDGTECIYPNQKFIVVATLRMVGNR